MRTAAEARATRAAFVLPGVLLAAWAPLVPFAKLRAGLDDAQLGGVLLCLGLGSLLAMPAAGALCARSGCRRVMLAAAAALLATLPLLALAATPWSLGAALFAFGAAMGAMDCAMNLQAVAVERDAGRPMMSGFHAFYSVGSLAGALGAALLLTLGATPLTLALAASASMALLAAAAAPRWRAERASADAPAFALPRGIVIAIGAVCFVAFLAEGAMLDWSAVFLHEARQVELERAGWGFVAFNLAMTLARLAGDRTVARLGRGPTVLGGALIAGVGFVLATLVPSFAVALAGCALVGLGCANIVTVMFTLAGAQTRMPASLAIPAVTTLGYAGVLAGPAFIGFAAQATSLRAALLMVATVVVLAGVAGSRLGR